MALFVSFDEFDVSLEHRVDEIAERNAAGFCARREKRGHLEIKVNRLHESCSRTMETAALCLREVVFVVHDVRDLESLVVKATMMQCICGHQRANRRNTPEDGLF